MVELMLVVSLIAISAAVAVPIFKGMEKKAEENEIEKEMKMIESDIIFFKLEHGRYPENLAEIGHDNLKDPWGNPYQYLNIE